MAQHRPAARPPKRDEYELVFDSRAAEKGWSDLRAQARNALADAWDYLTRHPHLIDAKRCHPLRGRLAAVRIGQTELQQWQCKVTDGGRIWHAVQEPHPTNPKVAGAVVIVLASTRHPNATDSGKNFR